MGPFAQKAVRKNDEENSASMKDIWSRILQANLLIALST